jgi:hypothetical protein
MEDELRLSEPRPGKTIWTSLLKWTAPIASSYRDVTSSADSQVIQNIRDRYAKAYFPLLPVGQSYLPDDTEVLQLASSALLQVWMIHTRVSGSHSSFRDAESWFLGKTAPTNGLSFASDGWPPESALTKISNLAYDREFDDVLPYVAETFETRQADLSSNRLIKRNISLYYTPSDVTEYMVGQVLEQWSNSGKPLTDVVCLDPACGSGVFLRALLDSLSDSPALENVGRFDVSSRLYGFDASWHAIQSCAFTLFLDCIEDIQHRKLNPWLAWQSIRSNLAVVDSTRIAGGGATDIAMSSSNARARGEARTKIGCGGRFEGLPFSGTLFQRSSTPLLGDIFGEAARGFSMIIGNPPYSGSSVNGRQATLDGRLKRGGRTKMGYYVPFVEMMWRFAKTAYSTSAMVLPLSLAYHSGTYFRQLRKNIQSIGGSWRFQFFDRTPDSLFGDLTKTRNCIVFAELGQRYDGQPRISTTPLIRWNSRKRKQLFTSISSVSLGDSSIERCIPKLGAVAELCAYRKLCFQPMTIRNMLLGIPSKPKTSSNSSAVYFYSTAYNWLPLFRHPPAEYLSTGSEFRANKLICKDSEQADFIFGVLSSRVAYWLWRVEGDGFHLNRTFLLNLPFHASRFSEADYAEIVDLAQDLWDRIRQYPVKKSNAGVLSVSYRPYACGDILDRLDMKILQSFEIANAFGPLLRDYVVDTVVAGRDDEPKLRSIVQQLVGERD